MPNFAKLDRTTTHIENDIDQFDSKMWAYKEWHGPDFCHTTYCYAGWTVVLEGLNLRWREEAGEWQSADYVEDGRHIETAAMQILEIDGDQADELFNGTNDLDDIKAIIAEWRHNEDSSVEAK